MTFFDVVGNKIGTRGKNFLCFESPNEPRLESNHSDCISRTCGSVVLTLPYHSFCQSNYQQFPVAPLESSIFFAIPTWNF